MDCLNGMKLICDQFQDEPLKREEDKEPIRKQLCKLGFREAHVSESLEYCRDADSALDWLCKYCFFFICLSKTTLIYES